MRLSKAKRLRELIEDAAGSLSDDKALEGTELFPAWDSAAKYDEGQRVRYVGNLYRCLQPHTAQAGWTPAAAPSLWARVLIEDPNVIPEWVQPDSTNCYQLGDKVRHKGKVWVSILENNTWEPGVYGWEEIT